MNDAPLSNLFLVDSPCRPALATLIMAHGAGSPMDHPWMESMTKALVEQGIEVMRFEFPYMHQRRTTGTRRPPPRIQHITHYLNDWLHAVHDKLQHKALFIGGKSMGARAATLLGSKAYASEMENAFDDYVGTVCFGYPFHPARKPETLRIEPLFDQDKPLFIAQGTRDAFGNAQEIESYKLPSHPKTTFHWIDSGDHNLKPLQRSGQQLGDVLEATAIAVASFVQTQLRAQQLAD